MRRSRIRERQCEAFERTQEESLDLLHEIGLRTSDNVVLFDSVKEAEQLGVLYGVYSGYSECTTVRNCCYFKK